SLRAKRSNPSRPAGRLGGDCFASLAMTNMEAPYPASSCPAQARHPVLTEGARITGLPACAGNDERDDGKRPQIHLPSPTRSPMSKLDTLLEELVTANRIL